MSSINDKPPAAQAIAGLRERSTATAEFQQLVAITNRVAAKFNRLRDTCVLTSFALDNVLQRLGFDSRPLRIEAAVFPDDRKFYGTILGGAFSTVGWPSTSTSNAKETPPWQTS